MANNNFEYRALGAYKDSLFKLLCKHELSEILIDLLMPSLDDNRFDKIDNFVGNMPEGNTFTNKDGSKELVKLRGRLFDVPFVYATVTETDNVICMDTEVSKNNQSTKEMSVTIMVMCHKNSLQLDSVTRRKYRKLGYIGKNRLDIATAIVGDILNHSNIKSIGRLEPIPYNSVKSYFPTADYIGKIMGYTTTDFMIDYSSKSYDEYFGGD